MTKSGDKRRTSNNGLPPGMELRSNTLRRRITKVPGGPRVWVNYLPGCTDATHVQELHDYCEAVIAGVKRGESAPPEPWLAPTGDPRQFVRRGMFYDEYALKVALARWDLAPLTQATLEHQHRAVELHVLHAFRPGEPNWTRQPIDRIDFPQVHAWVQRRKAEIIAEQRRIRDGQPSPALPGREENAAVRAWARQQGIPIVSDRGAPPEMVRELYRAAHSDLGVPIRPLLSHGELGYALWAAKKIFHEAVNDARILGTTVNPIANLQVGRYGRATGVETSDVNKRQPADPDDIRRIAARLRPGYRLPLWLGVILALRIGEIFGVPVRLWDPQNKVIRIEQQFGPWREEKGGPLRYIKPWVKTQASKAHLHVPATLADFITAEIERTYGHSLDDPWWDEPVENSWDPLIRTNRDLPICAHPLDRGFFANVSGAFWDDVRKAAKAEDIDLRALGITDDDTDDGEVQSHDLRRTIGAHIHNSQLAPDRIRSAYLRHAHEGTWEDSEVTARSYTAVVDSGLRELARRIDEDFIPRLGPLAALPAPTGDDRLVSIEEARELLGLTHITREAVRQRLRNRGIEPQRNPYSWSRMAHYRVGDLVEYQDPGDGAYSTAEVAALLWPPDQRPLSGDARMRRVSQLRVRGQITGIGRRGREYVYDQKSVLELADLYEQRRRGEVILRTNAAAEFGLPAAFPFSEHGIEVIELDKDEPHTPGGYVRRADVAAYLATRRQERVWTLNMLKHELRLSTESVQHLLRGADPAHVDPNHVTDAALEYLREHRDELLALEWNVVDVDSPPSGKTWVSVPEAARQLGLKELSLWRRARLNRWPAVRHEGGVYLQRSRIVEKVVPKGFVPLTEMPDRLGFGSKDQLRRWARAAWTSTEVGPQKQLFVELASVERWLRGEIAAGRLLRDEDVRDRLGIGVNRLQRIAIDGTLPPRMTVRGLLGATGVRLFDPEKVDRLAKKHTPPDGWITVAEAAERMGVTHTGMRERAKRLGWRLVKDLSGYLWIDPAVAIAEPVDVSGMLRVTEALDRIGLPSYNGGTWYTRAIALAKAGTWPTVIRAAGPNGRLAWWFPDDPEFLADLAHRFGASRPATSERQAGASRAVTAAVRRLEQVEGTPEDGGPDERFHRATAD